MSEQLLWLYTWRMIQRLHVAHLTVGRACEWSDAEIRIHAAYSITITHESSSSCDKKKAVNVRRHPGDILPSILP